MAGKFTKIPTDTFESLQTDAGVLLKSFEPSTAAFDEDDIITATTGGITASCVPTYSDMGEDVDNCPNGMLELMNLDGWECRLGFTALSFKAESIKLALGCATLSSNAISPKQTLAKSDFQDIWWVGDKKDGGMVAIRLINALNTGGLSLTTTKNGKGTLAFDLRGHYSIDNQNQVPMEIYVTNGTATPQSVDNGEEIPTENTEE